MKVKELIKYLEDFDKDSEVRVSNLDETSYSSIEDIRPNYDYGYPEYLPMVFLYIEGEDYV